jgi:hypothetical protein
MSVPITHEQRPVALEQDQDTHPPDPTTPSYFQSHKQFKTASIIPPSANSTAVKDSERSALHTVNGAFGSAAATVMAEITARENLRQTYLQLAKDRGPDADAVPLYHPGAVGALFKIRLFFYGDTHVAKGVEEHYLNYLQHET